MFKHITAHPWTVGRRGIATSNSVWGYENDYGIPIVADCFNKNTPLATQRANARLISIAPQMFELIRQMVDNEEAMELVKFMEADNENSTDE
jgi:hypothetical protein